MANTDFRTRLWKLCCSLKLAIVLASAATLLGMGGSLILHFNPSVFSGMEEQILGRWMWETASQHPQQTWWLWIGGVLLLLFGLNTLCCLLDWLAHIRARWRKMGEYMIHTGFVLFLVAFSWSNLSGSRSGDLKIALGEIVPLPDNPGYSLRLDGFEPKLGERGRMLDMISKVSLLRRGREVKQATVRLNHPLLYRDLIVLTRSCGQEAVGFSFLMTGRRFVELRRGSRVDLPGGGTLEVIDFLPHGMKAGDRWVNFSTRLRNPVFELRIELPDAEPWRGWYLPGQALPPPLLTAGVNLWPQKPLVTTFSILQANNDPGVAVAMASGIFLLCGCLFALVSFYAKRRRGDRPEID